MWVLGGDGCGYGLLEAVAKAILGARYGMSMVGDGMNLSPSAARSWAFILKTSCGRYLADLFLATKSNVEDVAMNGQYSLTIEDTYADV